MASQIKFDPKFYKPLDNATVGFFCSTPDGKYLYANHSLAKLLGYQSPKALIKEVLDIGSQLYVDPNQRLELFNLLNKNTIVNNFYVHLRRKDNSTFWALINGKAVKNDEGNILWVECSISDITELKITFDTFKAINESMISFTLNKHNNVRKLLETIKLLLNSEGVLYFRNVNSLFVLEQSVGCKVNIKQLTSENTLVSQIRSAPETSIICVDNLSDLNVVNPPFGLVAAKGVTCANELVGILLVFFKNCLSLNDYMKTLIITCSLILSNEERRESVLSQLRKLNQINYINRKQFEHSLNLVEDSFVFLNEKRVIIYCNKSFFKLFNVELNKIQGKSYRSVFDKTFCDVVDFIIKYFKNYREEFRGEFIIQDYKFNVYAACLETGESGLTYIIRLNKKEHIPQPKNLKQENIKSGKRILLVEDNNTNMLLAKKLLNSLGYFNVDTAFDGYEALELARKKTYDLILMDCAMPRLDGFEATQRIRSEEGPNQKVPIIGFTAYATERERQRGLEAGMNDYITKPVSMDSFANTLKRWLNFEIDRKHSTSVDDAQLNSISMGDKAFREELLQTFHHEANLRLDKLKALLSTKDWEGIKKLLAELYVMAATIGEIKVTKSLSNIIDALKRQDVLGMEEGIKTLDTII